MLHFQFAIDLINLQIHGHLPEFISFSFLKHGLNQCKRRVSFHENKDLEQGEVESVNNIILNFSKEYKSIHEWNEMFLHSPLLYEYHEKIALTFSFIFSLNRQLEYGRKC